jgi:hypothetical protein
MHASKPEGEPLFPGASFASHMPFLRDETLLFCRANEPQEHTFVSEGTFWQRFERDPKFRARFAHVERNQVISFRRWKLWQTSLKDRAMQRLKTGLPEEAVECSPSFYVADGTYHVSFIGGIPTPRWIEYSLYQMSGPSIDKLSKAEIAIPGVRAGFLNSKYVAIAMGDGIHLKSRKTGEDTLWVCPFGTILSLNYRADEQGTLIATCQNEEEAAHALLLNTDAGATFELDGHQNTYKPTVYGDELIFPRKRDTDSESYELTRRTVEIKSTSHGKFEKLSNGPGPRINAFRRLGAIR